MERRLRERLHFDNYESLAKVKRTLSIGPMKDPSNNETIIILPDGVQTEDNPIGALLISLLRNTGFKVKLLANQPVRLHNNVNESVIIGMYAGFYVEVPQNRNRTKTGYELGKTITHSLCVSHYFRDNKSLGLAALIKDAYFYGNTTIEEGIRDVPFGSKTLWCSYFQDTEMAESLWSVLNFISNHIKLTFLRDDEILHTISKNLIPFNVVTDRFTHVIKAPKKKGKKTEDKYKRPTFPKRSPLFTQYENDFLAKYLSYLWKPMDLLQNNWAQWVMEKGFTALVQAITLIYTTRWQTLQKFAKVTTKRLQQVRKLVNDDKLKKADITKERIELLINTRENKASSFASELVTMLPNESYLKGCVKQLGKGLPASDKDARELLMVECTLMYQSVFSDIRRLDTKYMVAESSEDKIANISNNISQLILARAKALSLLDNVSVSTKPGQIVGRLTAIKSLLGKVLEHTRVLSLEKPADLEQISSSAGLEITSWAEIKTSVSVVMNYKDMVIDNLLRALLVMNLPEEITPTVRVLCEEIAKIM